MSFYTVLAVAWFSLALGIFIGVVIQRSRFYESSEGALVIVEDAEETEPYIFLELAHDVDDVMTSDFVQLNIVKRKVYPPK